MNEPLGTPMEIDFTSAYLHYPLPQCSKVERFSSKRNFTAFAETEKNQFSLGFRA